MPVTAPALFRLHSFIPLHGKNASNGLEPAPVPTAGLGSVATLIVTSPYGQCSALSASAQLSCCSYPSTRQKRGNYTMSLPTPCSSPWSSPRGVRHAADCRAQRVRRADAQHADRSRQTAVHRAGVLLTAAGKCPRLTDKITCKCQCNPTAAGCRCVYLSHGVIFRKTEVLSFLPLILSCFAANSAECALVLLLCVDTALAAVPVGSAPTSAADSAFISSRPRQPLRLSQRRGQQRSDCLP